MHPEQIKALIRMSGTTPAAIADALKVSAPTVSRVIHGLTVSARVMGHIAQQVGKPVEALWPAKPSLVRRSNAPVKAQERRAA